MLAVAAALRFGEGLGVDLALVVRLLDCDTVRAATLRVAERLAERDALRELLCVRDGLAVAAPLRVSDWVGEGVALGERLHD